MRVVRHILFLLLFLTALPVAAAERDQAADLSVQLQLLDISTIMMLYDETDTATSAQVRARLKELDARMTALTGTLKTSDAAAATALADNWKLVHLALEGDRQSPGMLKSGYDARAFAEMRQAMGEIQEAIDTRFGLSNGGTPEEQAWLLGTRVIAIYIRTAGAPFGSYSDNNDAGVEEDLTKMVERLDRMIDGLKARHGTDAVHGPALRRVITKWGFIRSTIVRYTQQSTPTIVYRHGQDVIAQLAVIAGRKA